jgi:hypothetical protein
MAKFWDYGQVQSVVERDNGSLVAYSRAAIADQPYLYINSNGSIRREMITRDQLFDKASLNTIKIIPITNDHPPEEVRPEVYKKYAVGSTGTLFVAGLDGDFLGITQSLEDKDAIAAFRAGKKQISPGYNRDTIPGADGVDFYQINRRYNHVALVDYARGGDLCAIKDAVEEIWTFDPRQIDDSLVSCWANSDGLQVDAIDRLLNFGTLSPPAVNLDHPMTLVPITIGEKVLQVDAASVDDASKLSAEIDKLKTMADKAETQLTALATAEAANAVLTDKLQKLEAEAKTLKDGAGDQVAQAVRAIEDARKQMEVFKNNDCDITAAKLALDSYNLAEYKHAIVKHYAKSNFDASEVDIRYKTLVDAYGNGMMALMMPKTSELSQKMAAESSGSIESAKAGVSNGSKNGLPSDQQAGFE